MSGPLNKYRFKGIELADWGGGAFSLQKSWKKKDDTEWTRITMKLFKSELEALPGLIDQALANESGESTQGKSLLDSLPPVWPVSIDDDDIPF